MTTSAIPSSATQVVKRMTAAANDFLNSLDGARRQVASFAFAANGSGADAERYAWAYTPIDRNGLLVSDMTDDQRDAAFKLMERVTARAGRRLLTGSSSSKRYSVSGRR